MRPGIKRPVMASSGWVRLGLVILLGVVLVALGGCASGPKPAPQAGLQDLSPPKAKVSASCPVNRAAPKAAPGSPSPAPAAEEPLQPFAMVADEELRQMRGCLGVYYFDFRLDIDVQTLPQVNISSNFTAVVPEGTSPSFKGTTAMFKDDNVLYVAGPTGTGLLSEVIVTGRDNFVIANTQFNIHIPNATFIAPTITILPAPTLTGVAPK